MRVTIVGQPQSGKTAVFRAISGFSDDQIHPTDGALAAVRIPEPRLDFLETLYKPKKRTEATMEFADLPPAHDADAAKAGLDKHLPALRQSDALLIVVRAFEADSVATSRPIDPQRDLSELREEMLFADLLICAGRVERLEKSLTKPTKDRETQQKELQLLRECQQALEDGRPLSTVIQTPEHDKLVRSFGFLTQKPIVVVVNVSESAVSEPAPFQDEHAAATLTLAAALEAEIAQVDEADRADFMEGYGLTALARDRVIRAGFEALGLIFFLTAGEEEVRAWPIPRGFTAQEAAGKIHSDLARGFIRAETVAFDDLVAAGDMRQAKADGKVRQEHKQYPVVDGDIMTIKFNV